MFKSIVNYLMRGFLNALWLVNRIKIAIGIIKVKHGIVGCFEYKGILCSSVVHNAKRLDAVEHIDFLRDDDVLLYTYAKSGTHFTGSIIASIYKEAGLIETVTRAGGFTSSLDFPITPFAPKELLGDVKAAPTPRIIMSHLPWRLLPTSVKNGKVKIIHCVRNPKDVLCSMFPFLKTMKMLVPGTPWNDFVVSFVNGNVAHGSYFDFLKGWYPHRNDSNMLNLHFEDMKKDLEGNVRRVAEFLNIELTQEQIDRIVVANTFENKKKEVGKGHVMFRKGKSGAWKSEVTVEQNEMLDEWIEREMEDMPDFKLSFS